MFILLLSAAYLGLSLGGVTPVLYCAESLEVCAVEMVDTCCGKVPDCCSHREGADSRPGCCVAVSEKGEGWFLPSGVKVPEFTHFECYPIPSFVPEVPVISAESNSAARSPDPPGPAGRALLIRVSRQLV